MNDITVTAIVERLVVTHAPETAQVSLELLTSAAKGFYLRHDVLWIGYPYEEEVGYRIVGFDLGSLMFDLIRVDVRSGCRDCMPAPHRGGYGHCECECHRGAA